MGALAGKQPRGGEPNTAACTRDRCALSSQSSHGPPNGQMNSPTRGLAWESKARTIGTNIDRGEVWGKELTDLPHPLRIDSVYQRAPPKFLEMHPENFHRLRRAPEPG